MPAEIVTRPVPGPAAFGSVAPEAIQSQAAILLATAFQLRGDHVSVVAQGVAVGRPADPLAIQPATVRRPQNLSSVASADFEGSNVEFPLPVIAPATARVHSEQAKLHAAAVKTQIADQPVVVPSLVTLAAQLYQKPSLLNAAAVAITALRHPSPLVRVAAANLALSTLWDPRKAVEELERGIEDPDELVREVAATSLARYLPSSRALSRLLRRRRAPRPDHPASRTSMLVHGTFARTNQWWQPGFAGNFHSYISSNVWPDLYAAPDRFEWSGGYSDGARAQAATKLFSWVKQRGLGGLSLMTHSHGGSVAMLASWRPLTLGRLVLLSCPVHPAKYSTNFAEVNKVVSIRVKLDLVLLADGSGGHFSDPRYNEHVLPIWFDHTATHDPAVWALYNIPAML